MIPRYSRPEMETIWSDRDRMANWLEIDSTSLTIAAWSRNLLNETRLRNDVDPAFADIDIVATQDAVYVASGSHYTNPSPVEISKLALDGRPLSKTLKRSSRRWKEPTWSL